MEDTSNGWDTAADITSGVGSVVTGIGSIISAAKGNVTIPGTDSASTVSTSSMPDTSTLVLGGGLVLVALWFVSGR